MNIRGRVGSVVLEVVIAAALLATAGIGLGNLAMRSQTISRQSDQRLAAKLIAGNVLGRLNAIDLNDADIESLEREVSKVSGYDVHIKIDSINISKSMSSSVASAKHVRVEVVSMSNVRVVMHDWRVQKKPNAEETPSPVVAPEETE